MYLVEEPFNNSQPVEVLVFTSLKTRYCSESLNNSEFDKPAGPSPTVPVETAMRFKESEARHPRSQVHVEPICLGLRIRREVMVLESRGVETDKQELRLPQSRSARANAPATAYTANMKRLNSGEMSN